MTDPAADAAKLLPSRMKMADVKVGDRLVSTIAGGPAFSPITVTEITERGFRYKLDAPVCLHPLMGTTEGGEHFGHDGECFYTPENTRPQPAPPMTPFDNDARRGWPALEAAPPAGEPDFEKLAEEIEDWMPDKSPGEMSHKEYIRQFAAFLKSRTCFGINSYPLSDDQIRHMVDRFLAWRLPKPWNPDNGISYVRPNYMHSPAEHDWPTGTNLFDWSQAEAMVRYMIEGMPGLAARPKVEDAK